MSKVKYKHTFLSHARSADFRLETDLFWVTNCNADIDISLTKEEALALANFIIEVLNESDNQV